LIRFFQFLIFDKCYWHQNWFILLKNMKNALKTLVLTFALFATSHIYSQTKKDSLGLPGDNFDLYAALELFKQAKSPEAFEKAINSIDNSVNNLDLNADGKVDYVKVIDKTKGDLHSLVLQVAVSKSETQDVAVIEIEKSGSGDTHLQIVGDEELYGKNYIIEPKQQETSAFENKTSAKTDNSSTDDVYNNNNNSNKTYDNGNGNSSAYYNSSSPVIYNVSAWPSVQFMYGSAYAGWNSPYYWGYYPIWWQAWTPIYYPYYYRQMYRYHSNYYYRTSFYRCNNAHNYYYGQRSTSSYVRQSNGNGLYHERQRSYSQNPEHGGRYNAAPANGERMNKKNRATENKARENNEPAQPRDFKRNTQSKPAQRTERRTRQENQRRTNPSRRNTDQGRGNNEQPRNAGTQPQRANPQPRQQNQNTQRPAVRSQPTPRSTPEQNRGGGNRGGGDRPR
jgi:hypothetical protein